MTKRRSLGEVITSLRGERSILQLAKRADMSDSRWGQIERGSKTSPKTIWKIAQALDARPDEIRELFVAAGFEELYDVLTRIGASRRPDIPSSAESGILADPTLLHEDKRAALEFLEGRRAMAAQAAQRLAEREAAEGAS